MDEPGPADPERLLVLLEEIDARLKLIRQWAEMVMTEEEGTRRE